MSSDDLGDVTGLLLDWSDGDEHALERLTPLVYNELHRIAAGYLGRERRDHTLQATALVNEAFVRLVDQNRIQWKNSLQFTALAAQMMRRILVDHARRNRVAKRGGGAQRISLDDAPELAADSALDLVELDEALEALEAADPDLARVVELRFFGGMTQEEAAAAIGVSVPTVTRRWRMARAWLYRKLSGDDEPDDPR